MGTPDFAVPALESIIAAGHDVIAVYSQPPRPKGRGQQVQNSPVHEAALKQCIPVYTPKTLKTPESQQEFAALQADIAVVAAYGLILPKAVLDAPRYGCLNIHASLLPRWRGAAPIQYAILAGDQMSGVTIMQMEQGLDTGPMILKDSIAITSETTATTLHDELSSMGSRLIIDVLQKIDAGEALQAITQDDDESVYAPMLKKEDGILDWSRNAIEIDRKIRALNPWPGVWGTVKGARVKILKAIITGDARGDVIESGTILSRSGDIACGDGKLLQIQAIQPEGKKPMDFASFLNGGYAVIGDRFE